MAKKFARAFYDSVAWKKCREAYATKVHHLCERCLSRGILKPGEIVHHVIELTPENINDPNITLSFSNLQMVCRDCHAELHPEGGWKKINDKRREEKASSQRYSIDENGRVKAR